MDRRAFLKVAAAAGGAILLVASSPNLHAGGGGTKVVIPEIDGRTAIQVRNVSDQAAIVTVVFNPTSGGATYVKMQVAPANSVTTFYPAAYRDVPTGLHGPGEVASASQKITVEVGLAA